MDIQKKRNIIKQEFLSHYKDKYQLSSELELGEGHYAFVVLCKDLQRDINVAVKLFFEGIPSKGTERGLKITSTVTHNQIASTFTVEPFYSKKLKIECLAVVQKFVPGKSMKQINKHFDIIENEPHFQNVLNDFALSYINSLLNVISFCHSQGFGHGDLNSGNIITFIEDHPTRFPVKAILIDFDNSSFKSETASLSEQGKMENDIGLFKYFFKYTFHQWKYYEPIYKMFNDYSNVSDYKISYGVVSKFLDSILTNKITIDDFEEVLNKFLNPNIGFNIQKTIKCLKSIAIICGCTNNLESAISEFLVKRAEIEELESTFPIEYLNHEVNLEYKKIFDSI